MPSSCSDFACGVAVGRPLSISHRESRRVGEQSPETALHPRRARRLTRLKGMDVGIGEPGDMRVTRNGRAGNGCGETAASRDLNCAYLFPPESSCIMSRLPRPLASRVKWRIQCSVRCTLPAPSRSPCTRAPRDPTPHSHTSSVSRARHSSTAYSHSTMAHHCMPSTPQTGIPSFRGVLQPVTCTQ